MTPTKTRAAILRALRAARPLIWDGTGQEPASIGANKTIYICDALLHAHINGAIKERDFLHAKYLINKRINYRFSLTQWLVDDAGVPCEDITTARLQAHRIAWVDHLIAEFSAPAP